MVILGLDTSSSACSVAVWRDGRILAHRYAVMERGHAAALMPMVGEASADAGPKLTEVDVFAVTVGPGTYTGIRIGLAAARGLALAASRPLIGVTTLEAVAQAARDATPEGRRRDRVLAVLLETKRADVYLQTFLMDLAALSQPRCVLPPDLAAELGDRPVLLAGDAVPRVLPHLADCREVEKSAVLGPADAAVVAELAAARVGGDPTVLRGGPPRPLYLRAPDVTVPGRHTVP